MQTWPAAPIQIQQGSGLKCCGIEKEFAVAHKKRDKAKAEYDDKIAVFGRVLRVDEYQDKKNKDRSLLLKARRKMASDTIKH